MQHDPFAALGEEYRGSLRTQGADPFAALGAEYRNQTPTVRVEVPSEALPAIMANPEARAVIEQLQQQWGGSAPIFAPGDGREAVWSEYQQQISAGQPKPKDEGQRVFHPEAQLANAAAGAARDFVANTIELGGDLVGTVNERAGQKFQNVADAIPKVKTDGLTENVSRELLQFVGAASAAKKLVFGGMKEGFKKEIAAGAVGDFAMTGDDDKTLMQALVTEFPFLEGPVISYLAAPDDGGLEHRFKGALEGMVLSSTAEAVFKLVKSAKGAIEGRNAVTPDELQQAVTTAKADLNGTAQIAPSPAAVENQAPAITAPAADAAQIAPKAADNVAAEVPKVESKATIPMDEAAKQNFTARLKQQYDEWGDFNADMTPDLDAVFNTKKMLSSDDAKGALNLLVQMNREAITKITGGVQTHEKTIEMAKELADMAASKSFRDVLAPLSQFADNANEMAAQLTAGKQMMQWASDHVYRTAQRVEQGHGPQAEAEFLQAVDVLRDITGMVKGAQTAAARMTSAGRIVTDASGKLMIHPEDVLKIVDGAGGAEKIEVLARRVMSSGGNVRKVNHAVSQSVMGRMIDIHNEFWLSGILSGVKTHVVNMTSNFVNTTLRPGEKAVGAKINQGLGAAAETAGRVVGMEGLEKWGASTKAGAKAAYAEATGMYSYFRMAFVDAMTLGRQADRMDIYGSGKSALKTFAEEKNLLDAAHKTVEGNPYAIWVGDGKLTSAKFQAAAGGDLKAGADLMVNAFGKFVRMPSRFLMAEDEFFKQVNYRAHLFGQANRKAVEKGYAKGSAEYSNFVEEYFNKSFSDIGAGTNRAALRWSQDATFTNDLKAETWSGGKTLSETVSGAAEKHPLLRGTVLPFVRTPANLMRSVWDHTPFFGQMRKQFWTDITKGTPEQQAMAIGKLTTGSAMWAGMSMFAMEGMITGGGPTGDAKRMAELKATGWRPYSFKAGDEYIPLARIEPFGSILGMAADFVEMNGRAEQSILEETALNMSVGLGEMITRKYLTPAGAAFSSNVAGKSYLTGMTEVLFLFGRYGTNIPKEKLAELTLYKRVGSYIPAYASVYNDDAEVKEIRSMMDAVRSRLPGLSDLVPARRDYLGEPMTRDGEMIAGLVHESAVWPFVASERKNDLVREKVAELGDRMGIAVFNEIPKKSGRVDFTEWKNVHTGATAYDRLTEMMGTIKDSRGRNLHEALTDLIGKDSFNKAEVGNTVYPQSRQVQMLRDTRDQFIDRAWRELKKEKGFEALSEALKVEDRNKNRVQFKGTDALMAFPTK